MNEVPKMYICDSQDTIPLEDCDGELIPEMVQMDADLSGQKKITVIYLKPNVVEGRLVSAQVSFHQKSGYKPVTIKYSRQDDQITYLSVDDGWWLK